MQKQNKREISACANNWSCCRPAISKACVRQAGQRVGAAGQSSLPHCHIGSSTLSDSHRFGFALGFHLHVDARGARLQRTAKPVGAVRQWERRTQAVREPFTCYTNFIVLYATSLRLSVCLSVCVCVSRTTHIDIFYRYHLPIPIPIMFLMTSNAHLAVAFC